MFGVHSTRNSVLSKDTRANLAMLTIGPHWSQYPIAVARQSLPLMETMESTVFRGTDKTGLTIAMQHDFGDMIASMSQDFNI